MSALPRHIGTAASALELFHLGWDTLRIAQYWNIDEAEALRRLNDERSNMRRLPSPYLKVGA